MKKTLLMILSTLAYNAMAQQPISIAIEGEYPPFSAVDNNGELYGFDVDIANALCEAMQRDCELVQTSWDAMIPSLKTNKVDAIVASMSATEERKQSVDFTDKYYSSYGRLVLTENEAQSITEDNLQDALAGKVLGVQRATIHDRFASDELADVVAEIRRYNTQDEANMDLVNGRIDVTLVDQIAAITGFLDLDIGEGYAFAKPVFNDPEYYGEGISIAIRHGDDELREALNQAIESIREDGTYKTINDKYFDLDVY